jgi:hypothetical protein
MGVLAGAFRVLGGGLTRHGRPFTDLGFVTARISNLSSAARTFAGSKSRVR